MTAIYNILIGFCPFICEFIGPNKQIWTDIQNKYQSRLLFIKEELKSKQTATFQKGFLDNWILNKIGDTEPKIFLRYIDNLVEKISKQIPNELHGKLKKIVIQVLENFDSSVGERTYNSIGELFVIDYWLTKNYSVSDIEIELPDMKPIDFLFKNNVTGEFYLLEVRNFHPDNNRIESHDGLIAYFTKHYLDKFIDKTKGNLNNIAKYDLKLFPIIWIDSKVIHTYFDFFCDTKTDISEEMHILQGMIIDEKEYHYFLTPVSKII